METNWNIIIAAVPGIIALVGIIYAVVVRLTRIETRLDLIWTVFVEEGLRNQVQVGNLQHSSPYKLTSKSLIYKDSLLDIDTLRVFRSNLRRKKYRDDFDMMHKLIRYMGFEAVSSSSANHNLSIKEYLALCVGAIRHDESNKK
ncbi:hypothetical protein CMI37_04995 [Candidatus Pacearchaeota archaeon]|nr:hypothetical protein [Candidatus Pacearchaeota archaeon]|tara:strand:+ start:9470 stop:9901 length:432 start_codon:yes stop_codon:yes gene_type:complete